MVRRKHIRLMTQRLLTKHQVFFPPVPVSDIAVAAGAVVQIEPVEDDLSGFLYRDREQGLVVIGVNARHHPNRQSFTIAHELGHFLLHDFSEVHVDKKFKIWLRDGTSSQGMSEEEKEANLFAAELLMPARLLSRDIEKIGVVDVFDEIVLEQLAEKYGVSTQAMTVRLSYLDYFKQ